MNIARDSSVGPCHIRRLDQSTKSSLRSKALMHQVPMKRLACSLGWTTLLVLTAQSAKSDPIEYQCFERSTRRPVAASLVDLSTPEVSCEPTTLKPPSVATPEPEVSTGPSPYVDITPDPESVNLFVRNNPLSARRALNLARGAATRRNGGLRVYRPGTCMFGSATNNPCLVHAGPEGFEFKIPGGTPGWEQAGDPPSLTTRILVAADGRALLQSDQSEAVIP
ncbi:MAG: hypothetical protein DBW82_06175 [Synechococcus sp. MED-G68]|nr:MAG: hypothetical protein DBW82_06175 [Synechococcus sp. MED-G68]